MAEKNAEYTYRVTWSEEDNEYVGLCAEFPSLSWLADTPEKALKGIRKLVADVLSDMAAHNEPIPEPISCNITAGNSWSGYLPTFTGNWLCRRLNPGSASIVLPA
jgi:predicted RNase H-like HicB family nuclease